MPEVKRQTAYKCSVKMILEGNYVQRPGWEPNYIELNNLQVSRTNILGVIVGKEGNTFTLDDGTAQIQIIFFSEEQRFKDIDVGDVVLVIGRPREYNQKRFIVPEIIKKVEDKKWIDYRKIELENQTELSTTSPEKKAEPIKEKNSEGIKKEQALDADTEMQIEKLRTETGFEDNYASIILDTIRKLDKGEGANINDIIKTSGLEKAEKYLKSLINEGEIFEIRTGKIKVLE